MSATSQPIAWYIVRALLRIYPKAWRREYGPELADLLLARPLSIQTIGNVSVSGAAERIRAIDVTTQLGLAAMAVILALAVRNVAGLFVETTKTLPTIVVAPLMSELYVLFLVGGGCWFHVRRGGTAAAAGVQAMKITFIAGLPVMVIGLFMLTDVIHVSNPAHHALNPWAVLFAPLFRLPECWIWGAVGAQVGRRLPRLARTRGKGTVALALVAIGVVGAHAAQPPGPSVPARFDVASVKPNNSGEANGSLREQPGGRVMAANMPLRAIISFAYQTNPFTLVGGPDWIARERFDIAAKLETEPPPTPPGSANDPIALAMRTLLADRFKVKVHRETRDVDAYALVLARPGSAPGPALKRSTQDCSPEAMRTRAAGGATPAASGTALVPSCGARMAPGRLQLGGLSLASVLGPIGGLTGRVVVDRTGLAGAWDFELTFAPDSGRGIAPAPGANLPAPDPDLPSIFAALQEQLGLKLEPTKTPLDVVVIDSAERPGPD
jgi:uncharacterized protein (TIGR03435 family)